MRTLGSATRLCVAVLGCAVVDGCYDGAAIRPGSDVDPPPGTSGLDEPEPSSSSGSATVGTTSGGESTSGGDTSSESGEPPSLPPIQLPVEVFGPAGTTQALTVTLSAEEASGSASLQLTCSACGYHDHALDSDPSLEKAVLTINGGDRIPLRRYTLAEAEDGTRTTVGNPDLILDPDDAAYGGIGGAVRTLTFQVPAEGLVEGENTLRFEHVDARPPSIGFRIVGLDLLDGEGASLLADDRIVHDDPAGWAAPVGADPRAGEALWYARDRLYDPAIDALDGDGAGAIHASCSDCHATDGYDLAYFNFSNHSIVERSVFHGLTREEGEDVAAYIRSLDVPVVSQARPWNPPYQPGPGLDARPVREWAAGAGREAVLRRDADMAEFLFSGPTDDDVRAVVDRFGTLNMRELPIALVLPEWNQWLPAIHPDDAFDIEHPFLSTDGQGNSVGMLYYEFLREQMLADPNPETIGDFLMRLQTWVGRGGTCFTQVPNGGGVGWRATNSHLSNLLVLPGEGVEFGIDQPTCLATRYDPERAWRMELAKNGLLAWGTVKQWEVVHGLGFEDAGASMTEPVCTDDACVDASEARGWVTGRDADRTFNVFPRAPHYVGYNSREFLWQHPIVGRYDSTVWYHLQLILNPGYRRNAPSHFIYTMELVESLHDLSGVSQSHRYWAGMIKMRQLQTNGVYGQEAGLDLRTAQPFYLWSDRSGETSLPMGVGKERWRQLTEAFLIELVEDAQNATWEDDWQFSTNNRRVQPPDSDDLAPCDTCFESLEQPWPFSYGAVQGRNTLRVVPRLAEAGVDPEVLEQLVDWCVVMWPNGSW